MKVRMVAGTLLLQFLIPVFLEAQESIVPEERPAIPFVVTHHDTVQDMLWMAAVGKDDVVYDLGSGDGRIPIAAVRDFGVRRAVGVEINPDLIQESRKAAQDAGLADRVEFIEGDLFAADLSEASVVTLFVGQSPNVELRAKLFQVLKPGARVVSHQFGMGEWRPDKTLDTRRSYLGMYGTITGPFYDNPKVPAYTGNNSLSPTLDKVNVWIMPARMAGVWRGKFDSEQEPRELRLDLHQRLSLITGTFPVLGKIDLSGALCELQTWGDQVRFDYHSSYFGDIKDQVHLYFDGQVKGDSLQGTLWMTEDGEISVYEWTGEREEADFTGTWEWPSDSVPRSVRLHIERGERGLAAVYQDGAVEIPITDFYDFGGGFYFTLLIGQVDGKSVSLDYRGWLIGEATWKDGTLKGTIEFYPDPWQVRGRNWPSLPLEEDGDTPIEPIPLETLKRAEPSVAEWAPRRVE